MRLLLLVLFGLVLANSFLGRAQGAAVQVYTPDQLDSGDIQFEDTDTPGTAYGSSASFGAAGFGIQFTSPSGLLETEQIGLDYSLPYTNFLNGTHVLYASSGGAITLSFLTPVSEVGVEVEEQDGLYFSAYGPASDGMVSFLGDGSISAETHSSVNFAGFTTTDNTPISTIIFATSYQQQSLPFSLSFADLEFAPVAATPAAEPPTGLLFGSSLFGFGVWTLFRPRRKSVKSHAFDHS